MVEAFLQAPPARQVFSPARVFEGITAENSNANFSEITQNATFRNLRSIIVAVDSFKPKNKVEMDFKIRVLQYVLPFRVGETAANEYTKYSKFTTEQFAAEHGKYVKGKNDCYTYVMNVITASAVGLTEQSFSNAHPLQRVWSIGDYNRLPQKDKKLVWIVQTDYKKGDEFNFVPGDYIRADKSPFGTGRNHWGISTPEGVVVNRGDRLELHTLDQFLQNTDTFVVRRLYGGVGYKEYFRATIYAATDKDGKTPKIHYKYEKKSETP